MNQLNELMLFRLQIVIIQFEKVDQNTKIAETKKKKFKKFGYVEFYR